MTIGGATATVLVALHDSQHAHALEQQHGAGDFTCSGHATPATQPAGSGQVGAACAVQLLRSRRHDAMHCWNAWVNQQDSPQLAVKRPVGN
jgi:hypothetical protein